MLSNQWVSTSSNVNAAAKAKRQKTKLFSSLEILEGGIARAYRGATSDFLLIDLSDNWMLVHIKLATMLQQRVRNNNLTC